jgi:hypothetical protein
MKLAEDATKLIGNTLLVRLNKGFARCELRYPGAAGPPAHPVVSLEVELES